MLFAVGRELRLSEERLLSMPLSKLFQYAHCALLYSGCATRWKRGDPEGDERFRRWIAQMKEHERAAV